MIDTCGMMDLKGCDFMRADCHMHMVLDGVDWKNAIGRHSVQPDIPWIRNVLDTYRQQGYNYLRDGGDRWGAGKAARELAREYGITYVTPLAPLCKVGHYGAFIGETYETIKDYVNLVREHRRNGADFLKIMISGLMDFDRPGVLTEEGLDPGEIRELVHIAHQEGFSVMAHCNGARTLEAAAAAGVDSIEHGAYGDGDSLSAMLENQVVWVPTLSTVGNLRGKGRFDENAVREIYARTTENINLFRAMGGMIAPGTDAGAWAVPHGCATEEEHLRQAGVTDAQMKVGILEIIRRFPGKEK
jgi:hypothetical protein